jgi:hypothetical protein
MTNKDLNKVTISAYDYDWNTNSLLGDAPHLISSLKELAEHLNTFRVKLFTLHFPHYSQDYVVDFTDSGCGHLNTHQDILIHPFGKVETMDYATLDDFYYYLSNNIVESDFSLIDNLGNWIKAIAIPSR